MHLGIAQTSLAAWLDARAAGGHLLLRIEDVDRVRSREDAVAGIVEDLDWLGLDWDAGPARRTTCGEPPPAEPAGPYRQSERTGRYETMLAQLAAQGRIFDCTCTRREVLAASAPHGPDDEPPRYPGTCRTRAKPPSSRTSGRSPAVRLRTEPGDVVRHADRRLGPLEEDVHRRIGDFILRRSDGLWAYQFAVTVDDLLQGVTCIVRGDDLWASTGRQLLLRNLLDDGAPPLETLHVPLVLGPDGKRLAKRDGADSLAAQRERGISRAAVLKTLARNLDLRFDRPVTHPRVLIPAWAARWRNG